MAVNKYFVKPVLNEYNKTNILLSLRWKNVSTHKKLTYCGDVEL